MARGIAVVTREMREHFRVLGEQIAAVEDRLTSLEGWFDGYEERLDRRRGLLEPGLRDGRSEPK